MSKCVLPWISLETTPLGGVRPCCLFTEEIPGIDLSTHTLEDAFTSEYMRTLRSEFNRREKPAQCNRCWVEESAGKKSKREYMLEKFKNVHVDYDNLMGESLQFLDLKLGNICNLKCRICCSWSSSAWAQEERSQYGEDHIATQWLQQGSWPRRSEKFWKNIDEILPNVKYFEFTGGEPFLIKQHFDLLHGAVEQGYAQNIDIHYNTNGTQFPQQYTVWKHFKHVQIAFSIDNVGERFEYERDGANWQEVNHNIQRFLELQDYPFSFQICVTWNVQNILYLSEFLDWAGTTGIQDIHFNLMYDPEEFSLTNLPTLAKSTVIGNLEKAAEDYPDYQRQILSLKQLVSDAEENDGRALVNKLRRTDLYRAKNFADTHPEMARLIGYER